MSRILRNIRDQRQQQQGQQQPQGDHDHSDYEPPLRFDIEFRELYETLDQIRTSRRRQQRHREDGIDTTPLIDEVAAEEMVPSDIEYKELYDTLDQIRARRLAREIGGGEDQKEGS